MQALNIKPGVDIPQITLDTEKKVFEISGKSCPPDVRAFYGPVFNWLENYKKAPLDATVFVFKLEYYNTASAKIILSIVQRLQELADEGNKVEIKWYFPNEDEELQESGEEYAEMVEIPFHLVAY